MKEYLSFFVSKNLVEQNLDEGKPWDFAVSPDQLKAVKALPKAERRKHTLKPTTDWNTYTAVGGLAPNLRVSKTNPPARLRGLVADYDMVQDIPTVVKLLEQVAESFLPNFIEVSLSNKIRLVWVFEREVLIPSPEFCAEVIKTFFRKFGVPTLLAGYDQNSEKPSEMWTNGAIWYAVSETPLSWAACFGVLSEVSKKGSLFSHGEIALEKVEEEMKRRFPGRWQGEFKYDALGVRFWDEAADCPTGCQVKPDGMLCFTGNTPFMRWADIFGPRWVEEQRVLNIGKAAGEIYFDGKMYWRHLTDQWVDTSRSDVCLALKNKGLSDRLPKGQTATEVERVLHYIQQVNRVDGAAPLVNYQPGLVHNQGRRILNIANLRPVQPVPGPTGDPAKDFEWLWFFYNNLFGRPELRPLDYFFAWLQRAYRSVLNYERTMGQAVFMCGPRAAGKTLISEQILKPLFGGKDANPFDYMTGATQFNDNLFESFLLAINDEEAPKTDSERQKVQARIKGLVVNPTHYYHPKFCNRVAIHWTGRVFVTCNDDPASVGILPEVNSNTEDKMMFFSVQPYKRVWGPNKETESIIKRELPYFAHWLLNAYQPRAAVLENGRCGVKSYFDPVLLELVQQQSYSQNLVEVLAKWISVTTHSGKENKIEIWEGTPTELKSEFSSCVELLEIMREWTVPKIAKALTTLQRAPDSAVEYAGKGSRRFRIRKAKIIEG